MALKNRSEIISAKASKPRNEGQKGPGNPKSSLFLNVNFSGC